MQKRTLGNSNLEVSDIGLGRMGMSYSYAPFPDKQKMIALIRSVIVCRAWMSRVWNRSICSPRSRSAKPLGRKSIRAKRTMPKKSAGDWL